MMVAFDGLEDLFKQISAYSECSRATLTLVTAFGLIILTWYLLVSLVRIVQVVRLYFFAQLCCKTNFAKKYGRWAVITGATDGIGLSMAKELARRGQSIIIVGRNEQKLAASKLAVEEEGLGDIEVITVKLDLAISSKENYINARQIIDPDSRDIGVLINNAGTFPPEMKNFHQYDESDFLNIVNVNVLGVLHFTKMILPGMIEREKGLIVNVSSSAGQVRVPYLNVYGPSKTFIDAFSTNLNEEYRSFPIDIINLNPGGVQTKLFRIVNDNERVHKPTPIIPTSDTYARTAINAMSTRMSSFSGCFGHAFTKCIMNILECTGLHMFALRLSLANSSSKFKPMRFSPKAKKENQSGDVNTQQNVANENTN